ncbi:hypothetical protein M5689_012252 [Euphorbia peplus]|nr:hypothetical protein M5689_012252 [Euphorbia peplus]
MFLLAKKQQTERDMETPDKGIAQLHPRLVIQDASDTRNLVWYDVASMQYSKETITEIENKVICCSCFGWFILLDITSRDLCLFDPITLEIIGLPPLPKHCSHMPTFYILLPPGNPNCHVILFDEETQTLFSCKPKDSEFTKQCLKGDVITVWFVGGKGYALLFDGEPYLSEVAFDSEGFKVDLLKWLITTPSLINQSLDCGSGTSDPHLVEVGGELLFVDLMLSGDGEINKIVIWKLDFEKRKWIEIDDIGSWTIFISSHIAIAQENAAVQKNAVYFLKDKGKFVCLFDMIDRSFTVIRTYPTVSQYSEFHWSLKDMTHPF